MLFRSNGNAEGLETDKEDKGKEKEKEKENAAEPEKEGEQERVKKFRGVPENVKLFEVFWQQVVELIKVSDCRHNKDTCPPKTCCTYG